MDGYTYSDPNAFFGRWWSAGQDNWMGDKIVLLIVDYQIELTRKKVSLSEKVAELKQKIHAAYRHYGREQEEVWVVAFRVTRHT